MDDDEDAVISSPCRLSNAPGVFARLSNDDYDRRTCIAQNAARVAPRSLIRRCADPQDGRQSAAQRRRVGGKALPSPVQGPPTEGCVQSDHQFIFVECRYGFRSNPLRSPLNVAIVAAISQVLLLITSHFSLHKLILIPAATEPPKSGPYNKHYENGVYLCAGCDTPLCL